MSKLQRKALSKPVFYTEGLGFFLVIILLWLSEIYDLPHWLFDAMPTAINWRESIFETVLILLLAGTIMVFNAKLLRKIESLEELLPICAHCKNIRKNDGTWQKVDDYISDCTKTEFTHTICPTCAAQLYPDIYNSTAGARLSCDPDPEVANR
ncbi:MAG: hypothetical protein PWP34_1015 [Desulfuromonadales bacterium]|jgi:hypothetical protein|nr:hypothetical protein [Desulfuromonadales bacterium]